MKNHTVATAAVLLAGALVLTGCTSSEPSGGGTGVPQAEEKPDKLVMLVTPSGSYTNLQQLAERVAKTPREIVQRASAALQAK